MRYPWTCQKNVGKLGTPKLAWDKVLLQKLALDGQGSKRKQLQFWKEILSVNEDIDLSSSGGECGNFTLKKCEDETHTPKVGTWESFGTLETL
jgi:hypothetical protein